MPWHFIKDHVVLSVCCALIAPLSVFACNLSCFVSVLCSAPERVMLCLIPDMAGSPDVGMHIQHTLVRSFCWENEIRLLTVRIALTRPFYVLVSFLFLRLGAGWWEASNGFSRLCFLYSRFSSQSVRLCLSFLRHFLLQ